MINFEIKLSIMSCEILFALIEWNKVRGTPLPKKFQTETDRWASYVQGSERSHFVTHARVLVREGLVSGKDPEFGTAIKQGWEVTDKGYLMAKILKIEFEEAAKTSKKLTEKKVNQLT